MIFIALSSPILVVAGARAEGTVRLWRRIALGEANARRIRNAVREGVDGLGRKLRMHGRR